MDKDTNLSTGWPAGDERHASPPHRGRPAAPVIPPRLSETWQDHADLLAEFLEVPAALIRIADGERLTVAVSSRSQGNPYAPGETAPRADLYCEIALDQRREIMLSDATGDARLMRCAEREHGLPAYMGAPIFNPDGTPFGTIAVLDRLPRHFDSRFRRLLLKFRDAIQADLAALAPRTDLAVEESLRGQAGILEMIAAGAPLAVTLGHLVALIEAQMPGSLCSILLLDEDGRHLRHGAAPSMPKSYVAAVDGLVIGPKVGSCGTAMHFGRPIICADIAIDPLWNDYRHLALPHGLRACWSTPITSPEGVILGAFANYYREPRSPEIADTRLIELAVHIAAIAIEHKRADARLRANEKRFRDYAETASDWFWETDTECRLTFMSQGPAALEDSGQTPLGKTSWELSADYDEERPKWDAHRAVIAAREPFRDLVFKWRHGERGFRFVSASGIPYSDADGRFAGYRGIARDVTDHVLANKTLIDAKEQAEIASKAKSEFLANMSHELRTPLNAIIGFADFIDQEPLGPLGNLRYRDYVRDIGRSGKHLLDIINDMLDVARIEAGKAEIDECEIRLADTIDEVQKIMGRQIERARLVLEVDSDPAAPLVRADPRAMRQILLNLVSNAAKFTPEGGRITIILRREAGRGVALAVRDTGIGIAPEDVPKLMQPFAQLHNVYKRKYQGAGLGLTLVRAFTELHGGGVAIDSTPGRGTTVTVTLPESRIVEAAPLRARASHSSPL